jgi:hypothetical protein
VTADAPFFLSIAALSASLAGLAGLVAALRRGEGLAANDRFRLHEIVEFCFANILFAIGIIPLTTLGGSISTSVRIGAAAVLVYMLVVGLILLRRVRTYGVDLGRGGLWIAIGLNLVAAALAVAALLTGSVGAYQVLLVILLARPMTAFLFVLSSFEAGGERRPD